MKFLGFQSCNKCSGEKLKKMKLFVIDEIRTEHLHHVKPVL